MNCFQSIGHMKRFCPLTKRANEQIENAGMFNFSYQDFTYIRGYTEHKKAQIEFDYNRNILVILLICIYYVKLLKLTQNECSTH